MMYIILINYAIWMFLVLNILANINKKIFFDERIILLMNKIIWQSCLMLGILTLSSIIYEENKILSVLVSLYFFYISYTDYKKRKVI